MMNARIPVLILFAIQIWLLQPLLNSSLLLVSRREHEISMLAGLTLLHNSTNNKTNNNTKASSNHQVKWNKVITSRTNTSAMFNHTKMNHKNDTKDTTAAVQMLADDDEESFGACLSINDENPRLPEWIAYHYYMLPLRHLVLLVDPKSKTSPMEIVNRWRPFLSIDVWSDQDLGLNDVHRDLPFRQGLFYQACGQHMQHHQTTSHVRWVTFHDADEYLYLDPQQIPDAQKRMRQPGSVKRFLRDLQLAAHREESNNATESRTTNPSPLASGKIFNRVSKELKSGCLVVPRLYFGTTEEPDLVQSHVPRYLNGSEFETLRWLHHTSKLDHSNNGLGKSLVQVVSSSSTSTGSLTWVRKVHRVVKECAPGGSSSVGIRIRHYLGSADAYFSRKDAHRNQQMYEYRSGMGRDDPPDDSVRMWLMEFCNQMRKTLGQDFASVQHLLQGTGKFPRVTEAIRNANVNSFTAQQIHEYTAPISDGKRRHPFHDWLKNNYAISTLANGTMVATRIQK